MCIFSGTLLDGLYSWMLDALPDARITTVTYLHAHVRGDLVFEDYFSPGALIHYVKPDVIVFRSVSSYHEIAINRQAQSLGIPTVLIGHGDSPLKAADQMIFINKPLSENRFSRWKNMLSFYLLSSPFDEISDRIKYLKTAVKTGNPYLAAGCVKRPLYRADYALVFNHEAEETLIQKLQYPAERITVMGDPQTLEINEKLYSRDYVLFVDTDLNAIRETLPDVADPWYELFTDFFCILPPDAAIMIRLHPNTPEEKYQFVQNIPGVTISHDRTAIEDISGAALVCGFRSSLLSLALTMNKPVLLADQWETYFPAFSEMAEGLFFRTSDMTSEIPPLPWPSPSVLDAARLKQYRELRGFGLPSLEIVLDFFNRLVQK